MITAKLRLSPVSVNSLIVGAKTVGMMPCGLPSRHHREIRRRCAQLFVMERSQGPVKGLTITDDHPLDDESCPSRTAVSRKAGSSC
jgi:hypothetical protein